MIEIVRTTDLRVAEEAALVLRAVGIPFELLRGPHQHAVLVPLEAADDALRELAAYRADGPLVLDDDDPAPPSLGNPWIGAIAYVLVITFLFMQQEGASGDAWTARGLLDCTQVRAGEWYRAVTSLTLHSGAPHLIGNAVFGAIFGGLLARVTGGGVGWFLVLLSGFFGDLLNVAVHDPSHRALGASTAIFGALGILSAWEFIRGWDTPKRLVRRWAPIVMGIVLLGHLGTGGERTDVLAHLTGFGAGVVLGALQSKVQLFRQPGSRAQVLCGAAACTMLIGAWWMAWEA